MISSGSIPLSDFFDWSSDARSLLCLSSSASPLSTRRLLACWLSYWYFIMSSLLMMSFMTFEISYKPSIIESIFWFLRRISFSNVILCSISFLSKRRESSIYSFKICCIVFLSYRFSWIPRIFWGSIKHSNVL